MLAYSFLIAALSSGLSALQLSDTSHTLHPVHTATENIKTSSRLVLLGVSIEDHEAVCLKASVCFGESGKLTLQRLAPPHCHHDLRCRHQEAETCLQLVDQVNH